MQYGGPASPLGMSSAQVNGGDEKSLREFIAIHFGKALIPGTSEKTIVTIGQIPDNSFFADLPLSKSVHVIGTVERSQLHSELLFRAESEITDVVEGLISNLEKTDWKKVPMGAMGRGFMTPTTENVRLCHSKRGLIMQITTSANGVVNMTIHKQRNPCEDRHQNHMRIMDAMPALSPPQNIAIDSFQHSGGGSSGGSVHTSVSIKTTANLTDIESHYRQQLEAAGWTLLHSHIDDHIAVSRWQAVVESEDWQGLFLIMPIGENGAMHLRLEMQVGED